MLLALVRLGPPAALAVMILAPAIGVVMLGRDLNVAGGAGELPEVTGAALWLLRAANLGLVLLPACVIAVRLLYGRPTPLYRAEATVVAALLVFFATNAVLPGLFGQSPGLEKTYFYVLALFIALFIARADGPEGLLDAVKLSILALLALSFVYAALRPDAALRTYQAELRLPFVPFRFWGLSSGPNSFAPLALTLLLVVIARPFSHRFVNAAAMLLATLGILLAQSQTTWISAAVVVPAMFLYRRRLTRHGPLRVSVPPAAAFAGIGIAAAIAVIAATLAGDFTETTTVLATPGLGGGDEFLTGRSGIWRIAVATFLQSPLFGYGLSAWGLDFREALAMPYAYHAHNQLLQSLSVGGIVAATGLLLYASALVAASFRLASATAGLAPALVTLIAIGCISETPLDMTTPLLGETMRHALLFGLLVSASHRRDAASSHTGRVASTVRSSPRRADKRPYAARRAPRIA